MSLYLGIDPGLDGGIVGLDESNEVVLKAVMPTIGTKGKGKRAYDTTMMADLLRGLRFDLCALEKPLGLPGQAVGSTLSIGIGNGIWQGVLAALRIPFIHVAAITWQKSILADMDRSDTKRASALAASRMFPTVDWRASERSRKPADGLTDSACLALYAKKTHHNS
jgi:hypothetical protein